MTSTDPTSPSLPTGSTVPVVSWRDVADADAARWDYRVAEARSAAVDADPAATEQDRWAAFTAADDAQEVLADLVRARHDATGATLADWPAVVVSDVDTYVLPDELVDGYRPTGPSWYEQVRGITFDEHDAGPSLASVPAPADGRDYAERWDVAVLGDDSGIRREGVWVQDDREDLLDLREVLDRARSELRDELGADPWDAVVRDLTGPQYQRVSAWRAADTATRIEQAQLADLDDERGLTSRDRADDVDGDAAGWDW